MSETLSFEDKITGLAEFWDKVEVLSPDNKETPNPPHHGSNRFIQQAINKVRSGLQDDVGNHAKTEYADRGFSSTDLRSTTEEGLTERAGILAMMTAPSSPENSYNRADQIQELLGKIVAGDEIHVIWQWNEQHVVVDTSRELFTVFRDYIDTTTTMVVQYDRADSHGFESRAEEALSVGLVNMFSGDGVVTYS